MRRFAVAKVSAELTKGASVSRKERIVSYRTAVNTCPVILERS
ncbi:MAG: hypothetical protein E7C72_06815 [Dialister sp.]|nr:hypothetical protein [Dialister sp.]